MRDISGPHPAPNPVSARRQRSTEHEWFNTIPLKPCDCLDHSVCRWVKPNFVSGGAVPLSIYGKVSDFECFLT